MEQTRIIYKKMEIPRGTSGGRFLKFNNYMESISFKLKNEALSHVCSTSIGIDICNLKKKNRMTIVFIFLRAIFQISH